MSKEIKVVKAKAFEIDPTKKYILVFSKYDISKHDARKARDLLAKWGATDTMTVMVADPQDVKIIEL